MSLQRSEIIQVIEGYLKGQLSRREASSWAIEVLTKEVFTLDQILFEDAVTALAGLHDEDERWDTAEEDLAFFKECLEGKSPYVSKIEVHLGMETDDVLGAAHKAKEKTSKLLSDKDNIAFFNRFVR